MASFCIICNIINIICIYYCIFLHIRYGFQCCSYLFLVCLFLFSSDWFTLAVNGCVRVCIYLLHTHAWLIYGYMDIWIHVQIDTSYLRQMAISQIYLCRVWYDKMKFKLLCDSCVCVCVWVYIYYAGHGIALALALSLTKQKQYFQYSLRMVSIQYSIVKLC